MANDFTARVAGISVELGMSVQNKSGIWCKPTGYTEVSISRWETGTRIPKATVLYTLAKFYGVSVDRFFWK